MSKMSDLYIQIQDLLEQGKFPYEIAQELEIPLTWINEIVFDSIHSQLDSV